MYCTVLRVEYTAPYVSVLLDGMTYLLPYWQWRYCTNQCLLLIINVQSFSAVSEAFPLLTLGCCC